MCQLEKGRRAIRHLSWRGDQSSFWHCWEDLFLIFRVWKSPIVECGRNFKRRWYWTSRSFMKVSSRKNGKSLTRKTRASPCPRVTSLLLLKRNPRRYLFAIYGHLDRNQEPLLACAGGLFLVFFISRCQSLIEYLTLYNVHSWCSVNIKRLFFKYFLESIFKIIYEISFRKNTTFIIKKICSLR